MEKVSLSLNKHGTSSMVILIITVILPFIFLNCSGRRSLSEPEAEIFLSHYFEDVRAQKFEKVLDMYSPKYFYNTVSRKEWLATLMDVHQKLGDLKSYQVESWQTVSRISLSEKGTPSGTYVKLTYDTQYSKYCAKEYIIVCQPKSSKKMSIVSHYFSSKGLKKRADA